VVGFFFPDSKVSSVLLRLIMKEEGNRHEFSQLRKHRNDVIVLGNP
jgi:hypothetical protein